MTPDAAPPPPKTPSILSSLCVNLPTSYTPCSSDPTWPHFPYPLALQILHSKVTTSNTVELMPTVTRVVDLVDPVEGRWLFYCDVHDHIVAGMKGVLAVE